MHPLRLFKNNFAMGFFQPGTGLQGAVFLFGAVGFQQLFEHGARQDNDPPENGGNGHADKK